MEKKKSDISTGVLVGILVVISVVFAYGRFMEDSLRFDEAMEYWISYMNFKDMYGMVNTTYQPPVYNVVMHFWLQISDSVVWFKLSNVFFYIIGMIGLLKTVKYVCGSKSSLIIATVVPTCFSAMLYYNQVCGEYVLVLPILFWLIYGTLKTINEKQWKNFISFAFLAILSMGTQYGAMFTILGAGMIMLIVFVRQKDFIALKKLFVTGVVAIVGFMFPLYYFFARYQIANQLESTTDLRIRAIVKGLYNAFEFMIYAWHKEYKNILNFILICLCLLGVITVIDILQRESKGNFEEKNFKILCMIGICIITLITYGLGVAIGFYGYGNYTSRHTVLVLPVVITIITCLLSRLWENSKKKYGIKIAIVISGVFFVGNSFHYVWYQHWNYDQLDTAMKTIAEISKEAPIWVDYWATPTVLAYGEEDIEKRVEVYLNCVGKGGPDKIGNIVYTGPDNDVLKDFGGELPEKCYILTTDQLENIEKVRLKYENEGWHVECIHQNIPSVMAAGTQVWYFDKNSVN